VIETGKNGLLVPAGGAGQLAQAIQRFASDPELRHNLAGSCAVRAGSRFGLPEQAKRHQQLYEELRASKQPTPRQEPSTAVQPLAPFGQSYRTAFPRLLRHARTERIKKRWPLLARLLRLNQV
jgi:hypothetical protein